MLSSKAGFPTSVCEARSPYAFFPCWFVSRAAVWELDVYHLYDHVWPMLLVQSFVCTYFNLYLLTGPLGQL